jgi:hypothetical protein
MTLKNAALLAFIGSLLLTVLLAANFVNVVSAFMHDAAPLIDLLGSLIRLFAAVSAMVFFYVFNRAQSR